MNWEWIDGGRNRSTIKSFYGAGQEDHGRTKPFVLDADEPSVLLGEIVQPIRLSMCCMPWPPA